MECPARYHDVSPLVALPAKLWPVRTLRSLRTLVGLILLPQAILAAQADSVASRAPERTPPAIVTRGDLARLGIATGIAGVAYAIDPDVRSWVRRPAVQDNGLADATAKVGDAWGGGVALATGAVLWGGGLLARDADVATVGLRAVEAVTVSGLITSFIKGVAGRARPRVAPHDRNDFEVGRGIRDGNDFQSLPSGHTTAAFAFAAAVTSEVAHRAPRHARTAAIVTYGLGAATLYDRLHEDAHWLSDALLGAGIGMVSGWVVTRWHRTRPDNWVDRWFLRPVVAPGVDGTSRLGVMLCLP